MKLNAAWHGSHPMGPRPSLEQRMIWHLEHQRHCGCRPIPTKLLNEIRATHGAGSVRATPRRARPH